MSYDISLIDPVSGKPGSVPHFLEGGTRPIDGRSVAKLNVTYNYSEVVRMFDFSFRESLDGNYADETIRDLEELVSRLGTEQYLRDYWASTPGNAGYAANILLGWAKAYPKYKWEVR